MAVTEFIRSSLFVITTLSSSLAVAADLSYPRRPIRMLIPFPAGGVADTIGRTLGEQLTVQMRQPVVIDNRPGAGGRIAAELLAKSEADGYTLFVSTAGPLAISPALMKNLPYDTERDFLAITGGGSDQRDGGQPVKRRAQCQGVCRVGEETLG